MNQSYEKGQLYSLPLTEIQPDPDQPRKYFDPQALAELAATIREHGVLQPVLFRVGIWGHDPISPEIGIVSPDSYPVPPEPVSDTPQLILVAGERRFQAAQMAGLTDIPAICVEGNKAEIALVENLMRQDLTAIEEAEALDRIMKEQGYKQEDLSKVIGKAQSTLSEILSLNRLPQEIRDECRSNSTVPRRTLVEIAKSKQDRGMRTLYNKYKEKSLTKEQVKKQARRERKTTAEQTLQMITAIQTKIPTLALESASREDKEIILQALQNLKQVIEEQLSKSGD